jgi:hypothetical protein
MIVARDKRDREFESLFLRRRVCHRVRAAIVPSCPSAVMRGQRKRFDIGRDRHGKNPCRGRVSCLMVGRLDPTRPHITPYRAFRGRLGHRGKLRMVE